MEVTARYQIGSLLVWGAGQILPDSPNCPAGHTEQNEAPATRIRIQYAVESSREGVLATVKLAECH